MKEFCFVCDEEKDHINWKYTKVDTQEGRKYVWLCGNHYKTTLIEWVPDRVKEDRKRHFNDTLQPFRGEDLSKEYVDLYGTKGLDVTEKQVKNAKNVWADAK